MRPRRVRRLLALAAFGAVAAGATIGTGIAKADPALDYLTALTNSGMTVYNTTAALNTGYAICTALDTTRGDLVAQNLFRVTTWADVPNITTAQVIVIVAASTLCPWQIHPDRSIAA